MIKYSQRPSAKPQRSTFGGSVGLSSDNVTRGIRQQTSEREIDEADKINMVKNIAKKTINYIPCVIASVEPVLLDAQYVRKNYVQITDATEPRADNPESLLGTLADRRMGASPYSKQCTTCSLPDCSGHNGYIELGNPDTANSVNDIIPPFINPLFGVFLRQCLNVVCPVCGRLMIPDHTYTQKRIGRYKTSHRLKIMEEYAKQAREDMRYICEKINTADGNPRPRTENCRLQYDSVAYDKDTNRIRRNVNILNNIDIHNILRRISQRDLVRMGFSVNHPTQMLQQVIVVPATALRQSSPKDSDEGSRQHVDQGLRYILREMSKALRMPLGAARDLVHDNIHARQFNLFSSKQGKSGSRGDYKAGDGRKEVRNGMKGYKQEHDGKGGHIRRDVMGRREDYSARGVVTGDRWLNLGQIGVPDDVWNNSYDKIYVMEHNIEYIKSLYEKGELIYYFPPEAYYDRGLVLVSDYVKQRGGLPLRIGDSFGVKMRNGRVILFGRNPSIHKGNILSGEVIRTYGNTFRMHNATTVAQNMDYDGDEGNETFPQEPMAEAEARIILSVPRNIINTENSAPLIGPVMDSNTIANIMSAINEMGSHYINDVQLKVCHDLLTQKSYLQTLDARLAHYNIDPHSTRGVVSMVFPPTLNFEAASLDNTKVVIKNGVLLSGILTKTHIGLIKGSIIQKIYNQEEGRELSTRFINDFMKVLNYYASQISGYSVGIDDAEINNKEIKRQVAANQRKIDKTISEILAPTNDKASQRRREAEAVNALQSNGDSYGQKLTRMAITNTNAFKPMLRSKAKGDIFHLSQMVAQGGQQYELGKRLPRTVSKGRGSIFDPFYDKSIVGAGYIKNSLGTGFNPREQISHHIASRVTLCDTAVKTVDAGEYHHLENKALMDLVVQYDLTLRDVNGMIVQSTAGGDGIDPFHVVRIKHKNEEFGFPLDPDDLIDEVNSSLISW